MDFQLTCSASPGAVARLTQGMRDFELSVFPDITRRVGGYPLSRPRPG